MLLLASWLLQAEKRTQDTLALWRTALATPNLRGVRLQQQCLRSWRVRSDRTAPQTLLAAPTALEDDSSPFQ